MALIFNAGWRVVSCNYVSMDGKYVFPDRALVVYKKEETVNHDINSKKVKPNAIKKTVIKHEEKKYKGWPGPPEF